MNLKEQKIEDIYKEIREIISTVENLAIKETRLDKVERSLLTSLLSLGLHLLSYYIFTVSEMVKHRGTPRDSVGQKMKNTGNKIRPYRSVFGILGVERPKYYSKKDKVHYALDEILGLPSGKMSYLLSDWLSYGAVDLDFRESTCLIERMLGQKLLGEQSSRCTYELSENVENYYATKDWSSIGKEKDKSHLSIGFDGKGVPIIRSETERAEESVSVRLSRGQKKQVKKEATVSVSSSFNPKPRSIDEIINNLFEVKNEDIRQVQIDTDTKSLKKLKHCWHENKHTRAFLSAKEAAITYGIENVLKRDITSKKPIVVLIDGDKSLRNTVTKVAVDKGVTHRIKGYVLDFIHVLEYIWKVANAYKGEKNEHRQNWVKQQARLLLEGKVKQVIKSWEIIRDKGKNDADKKYSVNQLYNINRGITYFKNHEDMMQYQEYLREGYPITTGAIESACGHFVKSRMERNAMHWSKEGAQNMLNIRAIKKNGDWDDYQEKFIIKQQKMLYKSAA